LRDLAGKSVVSTPLLEVSSQSGLTVLTLHMKDLVEHTVMQIRPEVLRRLPATPERWIIDLSEVEFIASAGLGLMVQIAQKMSSIGGKAALVTPRRELVELFQAPYFLQSVAIFATLDEAKAQLSPH